LHFLMTTKLASPVPSSFVFPFFLTRLFFMWHAAVIKAITRNRYFAADLVHYTLSLRLVSTTVTRTCWLRRQGPSPTGFNGCSTRQPEWSVELGSTIEACPNCFTPSQIGWAFHKVSCINSVSQFTGVCRITLFSTCWTAARTSQPLKPPTPKIGQPSLVDGSTTPSQHVGPRWFYVAGPTEWNSLPHSLRDPARSTDSFRSALKTHFLATQRGD